MANKDDYVTEYRKFFEYFAQTVNPNDQLPVKLASYKLVNVEVVGGIIDWTSQYLTQKKCPESLQAQLIKCVIDEIRKSCKKHPVSYGYNPTDEAYEPLKLMQAVMAKTNEICLRYLDNSMLCSLPPPGLPHNVVSVFAIKNIRRKMEDRHVVIHDLNTIFNIQEASPSSYYAIFDGHSGHDAAAYSAAHLHQFLAESEHFINNPEQALIDAFHRTDALFINKEEKLSSGTTAVIALLKPKEKSLYIAWVGDSQALLVSKGVVLQCVVPHKPGREDERARIEQEGGMVVFWGTWRVNGQLAVSRAIGDKEYKPYVTAIPEIQEVPLTGNEDFLILACDGLWDFLSEDDAATTVYNMICTNSDDTESISQRLVQLAKKQGSTDNISVIVVFLREPSKIAADAHWATRNATQQLLPSTMETGALDNANAANNLFGGGNANGAEILTAQKDDFLLNLTDGFKQNGGAAIAPPTNDPFSAFERPANGKRPIEDFDEDEDMGPETDIDAVDDLPSPMDTKMFQDNRMDGGFNPFTDIDEKSSFEMDLHLQKQQTSDFELPSSPREETPTPPADEVHDAAVEENVGDSAEESEDEWNYFKGNSAATDNSPSKTDQEVAEINKAVEDIQEEEDDMSQLNPNAAEFVPVASPTRNVASPACRALINDEVIAQSPRRATPSDIDINLPNPQDFESEVKSRPSELFNNSNESHESENGHKLTSQEVMENLLNGRNIEEIEFHPSTPSKNSLQDEFHFGPNAAPFSTPGKFLDQSEAALSTKAVFGDESTASYLDGKNLEDGSFADSFTVNQTEESQIEFKPKEQDPMSMSFYQDENDDTNPFDLNKVQSLPADVDEFIGSTENGEDNLKENIKPVGVDDFEDQLLGVSKLPKTPEPEICRPASPTLEEVAKEPLPITPEPTIESREETDLCNLSSPPQNLVFEESVCNIKKPSVDSSPETEELSQISDAGDDVPNLCQSPDVVKDFEQFESDIKDVCQISAESNVEDVLRNFCGTQVPPLQEDQCQIPTDTNVEDDLCQFRPKQGDFYQVDSEVCQVQPKEDIYPIEAEPKGDLCDLSELKKEDVQMPSEALMPTLGDADFFAPKPMEASSLSMTPEPDNELICELSEQPTEQSPKPTIKDFAEFTEPTGDLLAKSPEPSGDLLAKSPEPSGDLLAKSPEPSGDLLAKSPEPTREEFAVSPESTREEFANSPEPVSEELAKSPEPIIETLPTSTEPCNEVLTKSTELCNEELAKSPEPLEVANDFSPSEVRPIDLDFLPDESKEIDSPMEDITSSVKDDVSSEIIEEAKDIATEKETNFGREQILEDLTQGVIEPPKEVSEDNTCLMSTPKSMAETESIATADLNSFLDRSSLVELTSPLSPPSQLMEDVSTEIIKTDIIAPQFAEEATILTPSTETPPADIIEDAPAPLPEVAQDAEIKKEEIIAGAAAIAVAAATAATATSVAKPKDKKPLKLTPGKPTTAPATTKRTPAKTPTRTTPVPAKTTSLKPLAKTPTTTKPASPTKAPTPRTSTTRVASTMRTTTSTTTARPLSSKPPTKLTAEKKPLMNGDAKPAARMGLARRPTTTTTTARPATTTTRPTTTSTSRLATARLSPTKPAADKPLTKPAPRPASLTKTSTTTAATKPRPTTLSGTAARPAAPTVKSTLTKISSATSPKTAMAKPRPATAPTAPRPRPATLTKPKTPDTEKQIKDSANKLLTSRSTTTRTTGSATARTTTTTTTLKKTEAKAPTRTTTTTKTTVTSIKSTKKPAEITRLAATKTKPAPTKTIKPQANGLTNGVAKTVVVQETTAILSTETELIKDLSPVENKFLIENSLTQDSKVAD